MGQMTFEISVGRSMTAPTGAQISMAAVLSPK
jgi:hypothetical protein